MLRPTFDWDDGNRPKVAAHGLTPAEVEEAFTDPRRQTRTTYAGATERRAALIGATSAGRILYVVFTIRDGSIRVVTAFPARPRHRREYLGGGSL